ncbi:MAG: hypothetical protein ACD_12C00742G0001, partial [uncultured bacterium]
MGISYTRFLAKLVSDNIGPGELKVLKKNELVEFLKKLKLTDAWGINKRMAWRLNLLGIYNLNDLRTYPVSNILRILKKPGYYLWANVNGQEVAGVTNEKLPKSVGHSYCVPRKDYDLKYISRVYMKLCEKTGR